MEVALKVKFTHTHKHASSCTKGERERANIRSKVWSRSGLSLFLVVARLELDCIFHSARGRTDDSNLVSGKSGLAFAEESGGARGGELEVSLRVSPHRAGNNFPQLACEPAECCLGAALMRCAPLVVCARSFACSFV